MPDPNLPPDDRRVIHVVVSKIEGDHRPIPPTMQACPAYSATYATNETTTNVDLSRLPERTQRRVQSRLEAEPGKRLHLRADQAEIAMELLANGRTSAVVAKAFDVSEAVVRRLVE